MLGKYLRSCKEFFCITGGTVVLKKLGFYPLKLKNQGFSIGFFPAPELTAGFEF